MLLATDAAGEGIDLQTHCHRLVNFDIPFNPSRLEQRIGRIDRYGQTREPQVFHFVPGPTSSTYAADCRLHGPHRQEGRQRRAGPRLGQPGDRRGDPAALRRPRARASARRRAIDANEVINEALAGGIELNARLPSWSRASTRRGPSCTSSRRTCAGSSTPRCGSTTSSRSSRSVRRRRSAGRRRRRVQHAGRSSAPWQATLKGLYTRLQPGVPRPITFDPTVRRGPQRHRRTCTSVTRSCRRPSGCCAARCGASSSPLNRVTAVVVDDLAESFVAAVTRMVLVGRGGVRLHEEVFLAGVRLHGRRAMAEEKAEAALDQALDGERLDTRRRRRPRAAVRACGTSRTRHCAHGWRSRCTPAPLAATSSSPSSSARRQAADTQRAHEIFAAFRTQPARLARPAAAGRGGGRWQLLRRRSAAPAPPRHRGDAAPPR